MEPSRLTGRGSHGREADRSVGSTILSHIRSGIASKEVVDFTEHCGANAAAELRKARVRGWNFMIVSGVGMI